MEISLTPDQIKELVDFAQRSMPNESCAFLLGVDEIVNEIFHMHNADESPVKFRIESEELLQAYDYAEKKKLQIIAIFHSHPTRPLPSGTDKKFMEINPVVWLIYSTTENKFKAYIYNNGVKEVGLKITA